MILRFVLSAAIISLFGCASGLPKGMIISPQWVDDLAFDPAAKAPELGFSVTLPDRNWVARRDYVYGRLMSFRLECPKRDAVVELLEYRVGEKAAGGPRANAERLRKAYIGFGIEPSLILYSPDERMAMFDYEMRVSLTTKLHKRVIAVWLPGAADTLLIFRGEYPPEAEPQLGPEMQTIVESVKAIGP